MDLTFDGLVDAMDEDAGIMIQFQNFMKKELERQNIFITNTDAKKKY